jgi:hypothetical protein
MPVCDAPDFSECIELLRKACSKPEFDTHPARDWIELVCILARIRWQQDILVAGTHNVNYRAQDASTIAGLAVLYRDITGREPRGMSTNPYDENPRRRAANPFPEFVKKFFAALDRTIGDEHLHKMIKSARKQAPMAFRIKR